MTYHDFVKTFTSIEAVHLDTDTSKDEPTLRSKVPWHMKVWQGQWQRGVTSGGCRNNLGMYMSITTITNLKRKILENSVVLTVN